MASILAAWETWLWSAVILAATVLLAYAVHWIIFTVLGKVAHRTGAIIDDSFVRHAHRPAKLIIPLLAVLVVLPVLHLPQQVLSPIRHAVGIGLIASVAWLIVALIHILEDLAEAKYRVDVEDNLRARKIQTQIEVLRRIVTAVVSIIALSVVLMTFPSIRQIGTSLLASAGLAGLIVGLAARSALSNLIAGLQVALTEPVRIEDVVIVEGEWGWIEEIGTTYVVVRIWDLRRLIVPLSYFIEKPFQNWTRKTADLLGTVYVYTDYSVPVEEVRQELRRIVESSGKWDGKVCVLQVTNATEHTMELRALMSASDSPKAWDLRCHVREKLIEYLQRQFPHSLPKTRAEIHNLPPSS